MYVSPNFTIYFSLIKAKQTHQKQILLWCNNGSFLKKKRDECVNDTDSNNNCCS